MVDREQTLALISHLGAVESAWAADAITTIRGLVSENAKLREAVAAAEDLAKDYAWTNGVKNPDFNDKTQWWFYALEHPVRRFLRARLALSPPTNETEHE